MPAKATTDTKPKARKAGEYIYSAGKRKSAVARVRIYTNGKGDIIVNDRPADKYFTLLASKGLITSPLKLTGMAKKVDITAKVSGGGVSAQAEALRHGISRGLLELNPELRATLKKAGFITRDARIKERKKPGLKRARRAPQFSKR
ncbi:30S ribosomal protein S9 [Candidatus Peregrinibacteria bacterium]|nr:30S ribosomal protein S9 [Candidatus Peregrinibacteria bacterium]